jgi:hypothetical protein
MRYGTPSVIVPYQKNLSKNTLANTSTNDQIARAQLLKEHFSSIILDYDAMTAQSFADAIKQQISSPRPAPAPSDWFNGADVTARLVLGETVN